MPFVRRLLLSLLVCVTAAVSAVAAEPIRSSEIASSACHPRTNADAMDLYFGNLTIVNTGSRNRAVSCRLLVMLDDDAGYDVSGAQGVSIELHVRNGSTASQPFMYSAGAWQGRPSTEYWIWETADLAPSERRVILLPGSTLKITSRAAVARVSLYLPPGGELSQIVMIQPGAALP